MGSSSSLHPGRNKKSEVTLKHTKSEEKDRAVVYPVGFEVTYLLHSRFMVRSQGFSQNKIKTGCLMIFMSI